MTMARLRRLAELAPALGEDGLWLAEAIELRLNGRAKSLDHALGLVARGGISMNSRIRLEARDALLRELAAEHYADLPLGRRASQIARDMRKFRAQSWPRLAHRAAVPLHIGDRTRDGFLFRFLKAGWAPLSSKQLRRILGHAEPRLDVQPRAA